MDLDSSFEEIREAFEERKLSRPGYPCMPMAVTIDGKVKQGREIVDPCEVDEGEIRVIYKYFMDEKEPIELNEKIRIKIELQEVTGISDGKWEFEFEADGKQLKVDTLTVPLSQKVKLPQGGEIILTEYKRNPLGTYIYYEGIGVKDYIIQLRGTTDRGQTVWFMDYGFGRPELGRFELYQLNDMRAENIKNLNLSVYWHELGEGHSSEGNYKQYGEEFTLEIEESAK